MSIYAMRSNLQRTENKFNAKMYSLNKTDWTIMFGI